MDRVPKAHGVDFKVWADRLAVIMMLMVLAWCLAGQIPERRRWWYIPSSRAIRCGGTLRVLRLMVAMLRILWTSWYD